MNLYKEIWKEIIKSEKIIITTHIRADGDCVGSAIGLKEAIKATYPKKSVKALYENLSYLSYLGKSDDATDEEFKEALVISVDNANLSRANDLRIKDALKLIKIDHHPNTEPFGTIINLVEEERCATAEMIADLVLNYKKKISERGLEALYTGIVTDTGRFKYPGVTSHTMQVISKLYELGLNATKILNVLDETTLEELRFKGHVLSNMMVTEHGVIYIKITPKMREEFDVKFDDASNMVNSMAGVKDSPIWVLFNELNDEEIRCRVRSTGIKINDVCYDFGGGGHENAGGIVVHSYDEVDKILSALDEKLRIFKENSK